MVWTCDRCGTKVEIPRLVLNDEEYGVIEHGFGPPEWSELPGWETLRVGHSVTDVCPDCLTDGERADRILRHVEALADFGEDV